MQTQEAEVIDISLEKTIENALVKQNVTDKVIAGLKEKFGNIRLVSVDDKESYLEVKSAKKEVAKWRVLAEKTCKSGREDAIKIQKLWIAKEKEVVGKIAEVEDPLDAEIKRYDDEQQRKADEIKRLQEEAYMKRSQVLSKMGALYSDGCFNLNAASIEASLVKESDEETWELVILPKFDREYQKVEALRIEQERIRAEKAAQAERERIAEEQRQAELQRQAEEARKAEELAKAGDKANWEHFMEQVNKLTIPQFKSGQYRSKALEASNLLNTLKLIK